MSPNRKHMLTRLRRESMPPDDYIVAEFARIRSPLFAGATCHDIGDHLRPVLLLLGRLYLTQYAANLRMNVVRRADHQHM